MRSVRRIVVVVLMVAAVGIAPTAADAQAGRSSVPGSKPSWAQAASKSGSRSSDEQLQFRVYLRGVDDAGAEAYAVDVSNPASPNYRHFLTPDQVTARFGPSAASVASVQKWLTDNGFKVVEVPSNRRYIEVTGTVAQAQQAFAIQLGTYAVKGRRLRAPDRELSMPQSIAAAVKGFAGLDQEQALFTPARVTPQQDGADPNTVPPSDGFRNAPPCSAYWAQKSDTTDPAYGGGFASPLPYAPCGYTPPQLRSAYGMDGVVAGGNTGQGVTVAIIDAFYSPNLFNDARHYAQVNDPAYPLTKGQFSTKIFPTNAALEPPDQCDAAGWYGEQTLDVEAVHAMAPSAKILYVGTADCQDPSFDTALNWVVSNHAAQIVSNSYGNVGEDVSPQEVAIFHQIVVDAADEGIGIYFSSGDDGDEASTLPKPSPDFPASDPFVTAVGGTSLGVGSNGVTVLETGWETGKSVLVGNKYRPAAPGKFLYGSGGGTSRLFAEPAYQVGVVPDALAAKNHNRGSTGRVVPDISLDGDPTTGMLVGQTQTFPDGVYYDQYRIGGTSLSCPLMAGIMALADHAGGAHGFVNPALYGDLAGTSAVTDVIHRTAAAARVDFNNSVDAAGGTTTSVRTMDFAGLAIATRVGYDDVTGLGTPNGTAFINAL